MRTLKSVTVRFTEASPQGAAFRRAQAHIDADIEGLANDHGASALMDELRADGVPIKERMQRLGAYLRQLEADKAVPAAE